MTRYLVAAIALSTALVLGTSVNFAQEKGKKYKATCPVSGKAIDKDVSVDYNGGKVYFCCPNCPKAFKANTKRGAAKANMQMVGLGQCTQVKCPFTGKDVNPETKTNIQGVDVCFCCGMCKGKAEGMEGAEQINAIFNDTAFKKGWEVKKKAEKN